MRYCFSRVQFFIGIRENVFFFNLSQKLPFAITEIMKINHSFFEN